jgi:hypothetical protein
MISANSWSLSLLVSVLIEINFTTGCCLCYLDTHKTILYTYWLWIWYRFMPDTVQVHIDNPHGVSDYFNSVKQTDTSRFGLWCAVTWSRYIPGSSEAQNRHHLHCCIKGAANDLKSLLVKLVTNIPCHGEVGFTHRKPRYWTVRCYCANCSCVKVASFHFIIE